MSKFWIILSFVLFPLAVWAQVTISSDIEFVQYPLLAPIPVTITVENQTSEPLHIGGPGGLPLSFYVTQQHYEVLPVVNDPLSHSPMVVPPGETASREVDLRRCVNLREVGQYTVAARMDWRGKTLPSNKHFVTVRQGVEAMHLDVMSSGPSSTLRRFRLMMLERKGHQYAFMRVDDEDREMCYGVYNLGPTTSMRPAILQRDSHRNVHLLLQSGPKLYTHFQFTSEGRFLSRQQQQGVGFPELAPDEDGGLKVEGLRVEEGDVMESSRRAFSGADLMQTPR